MAELTRIHLVRHGRVADEWCGRVYGDLDIPLSAAGEREAEDAASLLADAPLAAVVSSGLHRAEFGAELLRRSRGLARRDEPSLRELVRGEWRGREVAELEAGDATWRAWLEDPGRVRAPGGESLADLAARVLPRIAALTTEHGGAVIAIVAHAWVIRVVVCSILEVPLRRAPLFEVPTGGVTTVDWPGNLAGGARPTLTGFAVDRAPGAGRSWFRGAHRG